MDAAGRACPHAPQRRGAHVAEHGAVAEREDGRHPAGLTGEPGVTDGEHAAVHPVQAAAPSAVIGRASADPCRAQLPESHDAVLRRREPRDSRICERRIVIAPHGGHRAAERRSRPPGLPWWRIRVGMEDENASTTDPLWPQTAWWRIRGGMEDETAITAGGAPFPYAQASRYTSTRNRSTRA